MLQPKIQRSVRKTECGFCIIFILKGIMTFQSERVHMFYWTNIKTKRNWEWKIPHTIFERGTLCFSSYNNRQLQLKLFAKEKRGPSLYHLFCPKELFFYICVSFFLFISQCMVYWILFQNVHTFTYQKILLHTPLLLVFKFVKSLQCILNPKNSQVICPWSLWIS